ncbi:hypothetical protein ABVT39_012828 [Epinephelus coioides]
MGKKRIGPVSIVGTGAVSTIRKTYASKALSLRTKSLPMADSTAADEPKPQRPTESPQPESPQPESPQPESRGRIGLYVGLTAAALLTLCVGLCFAFKAHFVTSADKRDHFCAVV